MYGLQGFYRKNLTGGPLSGFVKQVDEGKVPLLFTPALAKKYCRGGIVNDYLRLISYEPRLSFPRLLVLVLDKRRKPEDAFGRVIQAVDFERPAITLFDNKNFIAKCWSVGRSA